MTIRQKIEALDEDALVDLISDTAKLLKRQHKKVRKSCEAEINTSAHVSRAKRTTLVANSWNNREMFNKYAEQIYWAAKRLR